MRESYDGMDSSATGSYNEMDSSATGSQRLVSGEDSICHGSHKLGGVSDGAQNIRCLDAA